MESKGYMLEKKEHPQQALATESSPLDEIYPAPSEPCLMHASIKKVKRRETNQQDDEHRIICMGRTNTCLQTI